MGKFQGPQVFSLDGQLGQKANIADNVKGLIYGGVATGGMPLGTVKRLTKLSDAEALGLNASYDATNKVLVHASIKEFFRLQPEGILYIIGCARATTQAVMITAMLPLLLKSDVVKERISTVALKRNPAADYEAVQVAGIWNEITPAITALATTLTALEAEGYYCGTVIIDGSYCNTTYASYTDIRALNECGGVMVVIGSDYDLANMDVVYKYHADVASALGLMAQRKASESIAALRVLNPPKKYKGASTLSLVDTASGRWLKPQVTSGELVTAVSSAQIQEFINKGYTLFGPYGNNVGIYAGGGGSAKPVTSDVAWHERYEVLQKAKHLAYQFFLPLKNSSVELVDQHLASDVVAWLETEATNAVLGVLREEGNISEFQGIDGAGVFIPNDYNFITGTHDSGDSALDIAPETLKVEVAVPIKGILRNFTIYVGLK
jgi:hypothetical protein